MEEEAGAYQYAGGGGGSGFIWTSETSSNVPSGYSVGEEYYLTDAATYNGGSSSIPAPGISEESEIAVAAAPTGPGEDSGETEIGAGDGNARITLVSGTIASTLWIDADKQIQNGTLTGEFMYNGYTVTVTNAENVTVYPVPTVTAEVSNITTKSATITAKLRNPVSGTVQCTLTVNGTTYGPSKTKEWNIDNLNDDTTYEYTVEAAVGEYTSSMQGEFTTNELPSPDVANVSTTTTTAFIAVNPTDGDLLNAAYQYFLTINGITYGPSRSRSFNIQNLNDNTTYEYTVGITDGTNTKTITRELKIECIHNYVFDELPEGAGKKFTSTGEYSDGTNTAVIPAGFTVSRVGGICTKCGNENPKKEWKIDDGLVIYLIDDKTEEEIAAIDWMNETTVANLQKTYDQFVWIPMPQENINDMYMCQKEDGTKSCRITINNGMAYCTTHKSTLMAGRLYVASEEDKYNASLTTQKYTSGSGHREPDVLADYYDGETELLTQLNEILGTNYISVSNFKTGLQSEYNKVVKSVYQNEGFYIGRYETSGMVNSNTNATIKVVAGSDNSNNASISYVTWHRAYAQQRKYAENKGLTSSIGSTMIQGAAYDQVMKFVDPSTSFVKGSGRVSQDLDNLYQTGGLNYPGTKTYKDICKNIYDLEGNISAMTTEAYDDDSRVVRGGTYSSDDWGEPQPPCDRWYEDLGITTSNGSVSNNMGSICQLYVIGEVE